MIKKITLSGKTVEYEFVRKNIKNLHLRVRDDCSVYVSAPQRAPVSAVEDFIRSNEDFLFAAIKKQKESKPPLKWWFA